MTDNKFRAVLTIFGDFKVLEIRFNGLTEEKTRVKAIPNVNNRHIVNTKAFITAFLNLTIAINSYADSIAAKALVAKMLGIRF